ncbi:1885_t:CDS:1 [Ambispora leptoticha]|uniref:1885_t:CDS:1 n=1 Tax=Ambispora leptoticha TaxID=144679 RepID=A0A9N9AQ94_9GLOM|nr:1885_t:CDS:1 [Ambispora leptoticha]
MSQKFIYILFISLFAFISQIAIVKSHVTTESDSLLETLNYFNSEKTEYPVHNYLSSSSTFFEIDIEPELESNQIIQQQSLLSPLNQQYTQQDDGDEERIRKRQLLLERRRRLRERRRRLRERRRRLRERRRRLRERNQGQTEVEMELNYAHM